MVDEVSKNNMLSPVCLIEQSHHFQEVFLSLSQVALLQQYITPLNTSLPEKNKNSLSLVTVT